MHISRVSQCFTVIPAWEAWVITIIRRPLMLLAQYSALLAFNIKLSTEYQIYHLYFMQLD